MTLLVKICGLSTPETLDVALDAGADMVGFMFFPPRRATCRFTRRASLARRVKGRAEKVAVTVDADDATLTTIVEALQPGLLQLHGKETPARVGAIRQRFGLPVMKVLAIETKADLGAIPLYAEDRRPPAVRRARRRARRRGRAGSASRSTGTCWKVSTRQFHSCFPAASMPQTSREALRDHARARRRRLVRRRKRPRREGPGENPRLHPRGARFAWRRNAGRMNP